MAIAECRRDRLRQGALLELAHEVAVDRIAELGGDCGKLGDLGPAGEARERADEDETAHALGVIGRDAAGDRTPHRVPGDDRALDPERVEQLDDVLREVADAVALGPRGSRRAAL